MDKPPGLEDRFSKESQVYALLFMSGESGFAELVLGGTFLRRFGKPITQSGYSSLGARTYLLS